MQAAKVKMSAAKPEVKISASIDLIGSLQNEILTAVLRQSASIHGFLIINLFPRFRGRQFKWTKCLKRRSRLTLEMSILGVDISWFPAAPIPGLTGGLGFRQVTRFGFEAGRCRRYTTLGIHRVKVTPEEPYRRRCFTRMRRLCWQCMYQFTLLIQCHCTGTA
jgi:hypothetical protein